MQVNKDEAQDHRLEVGEGTSRRLNSPAGRLALAAGGAVLGTAVVLAGVLLLVNREAWWRGYLAATVISALSGLAAVGPLAWGLKRSLDKAVGVYFATAAVRITISIGGGLLAVLSGGYPPVPTFVLIVMYYLVLLAVETTVVARTIWSAAA